MLLGAFNLAHNLDQYLPLKLIQTLLDLFLNLEWNYVVDRYRKIREGRDGGEETARGFSKAVAKKWYEIIEKEKTAGGKEEA